MDMFPCMRNFTALGGWALTWSKCRNKSLDDKNNSNEIILIAFFLKVKEVFPFLDVLKRRH